MPASSTQTRICPSGCGPLRSFQFRGVILDRCPQCAGTWFDAGEYDALERLPEAAFYALEGLTGSAAVTPTIAEGERLCPACRTQLVPIRLQHKGVALRLDQCPACEGFWAEDHEMDLLSQGLERHKPAFGETVPQGARGDIAWAVAQEMTDHDIQHVHVFQSVAIWVRRWKSPGA